MMQTSPVTDPGIAAGENPKESGRTGSPNAGSASTNIRPYVPENGKQQTSPRENMNVLMGGGGILIAILLLIFMRVFHPSSSVPKPTMLEPKKTTLAAQSTESKVPITDTVHTDQQSGDGGPLNSGDIARTATKHPDQVAANLGAISPFDSQWQPPACQQSGVPSDATDTSDEATEDKSEKAALEKASLVYVRSVPSSTVPRESRSVPLDLGIGLPPGTKLRARIEAAVSTAVQTPVLAVIEYNYEKNGEIVVPAGAKALGHLEAADATGYVNVRFDSLLMPDGSFVAIEGAATDLRLRPVKGKVEGKHTGKNILVRSFAGLGEITATLAGRGSLDQSLSEGDLIRERAANNIAQASDQQLANLAVSQHIVVTVPADSEIYVVLAKPAAVRDHDSQSPINRVASASSNADQLRQLLQLQRELNQQADTIAKQ